MNARNAVWPGLVLLGLWLGGCAGVRDSPLAQSAAKAVIAADAYDDYVRARRDEDSKAATEALNRFAKAAPEKLESDDPDFLNQVGYTLADKGSSADDFQRAEALTRRAVEIYDRHIEQLNQIIKESGKSGAGDVQPPAKPALGEKAPAGLSRLLLGMSDAEKDRLILRSARAQTRDSLAWALYRRGKLDEAEKEQRDAVREARETESLSAELPLHLADILAKAGKSSEARAAYAESLTLPFGEPDAHERARAALDKLK